MAPLHLKLDGIPFRHLKSGDMQMTLVFTTTNNASMRLFRSADTNYGGFAYLTNAAIASNQVSANFNSQLALFSGPSNRFTFTSNYWSNLSTNYATNYLLFEGVTAGDVKLHVEFRDKFQTNIWINSQPAYIRLRDVSELYEHFTAGDNTTTEWHQIRHESWGYTTDSGRFTTNSNGDSSNYILFVHGWRMEPWDRRAFAETAFKRLWWAGYAGRFGLFSWPTKWASVEYFPFTGAGVPDPLDPRNFDFSEHRAWRSGSPLREVLVHLNRQYPGKVRVFAHSMGNIPVSEALNLATANRSGILVNTYIACQAAIAAHTYDGSITNRELRTLGIDLDSLTYNLYKQYPQNTLPISYDSYLKGVDGAVSFINYYNPVDNALSGWTINQNLKPDFGWGYHQDYNYYRGYFNRSRLTVGKHDYEIFAHAAEARSLAVGAEGQTGGAFMQGPQYQRLNLQATYGWGANSWEHSAQFLSTVVRRSQFWTQLLIDFGL